MERYYKFYEYLWIHTDPVVQTLFTVRVAKHLCSKYGLSHEEFNQEIGLFCSITNRKVCCRLLKVEG